MTASAMARDSHGVVERTLRRVAIVALSGLLMGCVERDMTDLQAEVQSILVRKGSRIDELPPIEPYQVYTFRGGLDPFEPFYKEEATPSGGPAIAGGSGIAPNLERNREELESYSLDSLRMMGTLELEEELWGIVRSPDGTIHRVQVGNYMGRNHGKIVSISEESIDLNEIIQDAQGGWQERDAALALAEQ